MGCVSSCMANDSFGREVTSKHTQHQPHAVGWELELLQTLESIEDWRGEAPACGTTPFPNGVRLLGQQIASRSNTRPAQQSSWATFYNPLHYNNTLGRKTAYLVFVGFFCCWIFLQRSSSVHTAGLAKIRILCVFAAPACLRAFQTFKLHLHFCVQLTGTEPITESQDGLSWKGSQRSPSSHLPARDN